MTLLAVAVKATLLDAGIVAGSITAVLVLLGTVGRSKPGRWLWRQLVGQPVGAWLEGVVERQVAPIRERVDQVSARTEEHMEREEADRLAIRHALDALGKKLDQHLPEAARRDARLDAHDEALGVDTREPR